MKIYAKAWPYIPIIGIFKVFQFDEKEVGLDKEYVQITSAIVQGFSLSVILQTLMIIFL